MRNRLFKDVRAELSRVAGQTGFQPDDPRLIDQVNLAQERLLQEGNWPGILVRARMCIYGGILALPEEYDALFRVAFNSEPLPVASQWFEFLDYGPGVLDSTSRVTHAVDRGESPVICHPRGKKIKAYGPGNVTIYADGTQFTLTPGTTSTEAVPTSVGYSNITRVELSEPEAIELVYEDADGGEFLGARYNGTELRPSLRIYDIHGATAGDTVDVLLRRRFRGVEDGESPLLISNLPALRNMLISLYKEETGELEMAEAYLQRAILSMKAENQRYFGAENPHINLSSSIQAFGEIPSVI